MKKFLTIAGICCVLPLIVIAAIFWVLSNDNPDSVSEQGTPIGQEIPVLGREHVPEGTKVTDYNSNPPTSGKHWPSPAEWGAYSSPLPDEQLVHNLEHGGIWISYKEVGDATKEKLNAFAATYPQAVIVTPRAENDSAIVAASWGRALKFEAYNEQLIEDFIRSNVNRSPEPLASLEQLSVAVGNPFPSFSVTEVDGRTITNETLRDKPAIVWFTTEFCVPCQIGAREVSKLDDELGGDAFDVLVIFVDPRETEEDLRSWRERFARDDWMVAFDNFADEQNALSPKVGLKFLDSKYLLDRDGVIQNIDFQIADKNYLDVIRGVTTQ
ncbi:MAG TPA: DUF3105 domain-containing protein [Candidatus Paceibacterota bacterium]